MTKTILITGSTDGIGLLTAKMLADQGHTVILHGRSAAKLKTAVDEVGHGAKSYQADLSSISDVTKLASDIRADHDHLDVLINNAGVYKTPDPILANGQDVRFVVNTVAPHVLTQALLPIIPTDGRVVNLSSAAQAPVDTRAMLGQTRLNDMGAYAQSKRAITLWSAEMARKLPSGPAFIAVNPGSLLASKMVKEGFGVAGHDLRIGADILCRLSLDSRFETASGKYWDNDAGQFGMVDHSQTAKVMDALDQLSGNA